MYDQSACQTRTSASAIDRRRHGAPYSEIFHHAARAHKMLLAIKNAQR